MHNLTNDTTLYDLSDFCPRFQGTFFNIEISQKRYEIEP